MFNVHQSSMEDHSITLANELWTTLNSVPKCNRYSPTLFQKYVHQIGRPYIVWFFLLCMNVIVDFVSKILEFFKLVNTKTSYRISANSFLPWIFSPFNSFRGNYSIYEVKRYHNFHIFHFQKRIVYTETIHSNTVSKIWSLQFVSFAT